MDERFPKFLRTLLRKLDFLGLPNLGMLVCGLTILGFIGQNFLGAPFERFLFDPQAVMQGEWWRLFAFPADQGLNNPIWLLFYCMYVFFVMNALESHWGAGPLTVFTLLAYVAALGASFLAMRPLSIWYYVIENVSLAFGTLFPEVELYLFFILPVKAKWLAMLFGAFLFLKFIAGEYYLAVALAPYLLFFSPLLFSEVRGWIRRRKNRKRFDQDMWR